jgi:hypothetical protein
MLLPGAREANPEADKVRPGMHTEPGQYTLLHGKRKAEVPSSQPGGTRPDDSGRQNVLIEKPAERRVYFN